jgi:hypothetical protein
MNLEARKPGDYGIRKAGSEEISGLFLIPEFLIYFASIPFLDSWFPD